MANNNLPNYLRTLRKSLGFSQDEIAYLLGFHSANLSKFERFRRTPGFRIALAFEVIFKLSIRELFPSDFREIEKAIRKRALRLSNRLSSAKSDPQTLRKLAHLQKILAGRERE